MTEAERFVRVCTTHRVALVPGSLSCPRGHEVRTWDTVDREKLRSHGIAGLDAYHVERPDVRVRPIARRSTRRRTKREPFEVVPPPTPAVDRRLSDPPLKNDEARRHSSECGVGAAHGAKIAQSPIRSASPPPEVELVRENKTVERAKFVDAGGTVLYVYLRRPLGQRAGSFRVHWRMLGKTGRAETGNAGDYATEEEGRAALQAAREEKLDEGWLEAPAYTRGGSFRPIPAPPKPVRREAPRRGPGRPRKNALVR